MTRRHKASTFGDIATAIQNTVCKKAVQSNTLCVVFDTSEKDINPNHREDQHGEQPILQLIMNTARQLVRQWRAFLKLTEKVA